MAGRVLIVGNGISRDPYKKEILMYGHEVWGCNYAFRDFHAVLDRLTGHTDQMIEAEEFKKKFGFDYQIYSGAMTKRNRDWAEFSVDPKWRRDSGTTMVAQALHEGYDVELVGFDLGGPDIYSKDHYLNDKTNWVKRWAEIFDEWGHDRIKFWGHDHAPFIEAVRLGSKSPCEYARLYKARKPHITSEEYLATHAVFVPAKQPKRMGTMKVMYPNNHIGEVSKTVGEILIKKGQAIAVDEPDQVEKPDQGKPKKARK